MPKTLSLAEQMRVIFWSCNVTRLGVHIHAITMGPLDGPEYSAVAVMPNWRDAFEGSTDVLVTHAMLGGLPASTAPWGFRFTSNQ